MHATGCTLSARPDNPFRATSGPGPEASTAFDRIASVLEKEEK
jgi:hypothetical protein